MKTSARYKAVLELMEDIFQDIRPADNIINEYFRARKYIGSSDRRFIGDEIWNVIRKRRRLEFEANSSDLLQVLACYLKDENLDEIFDGSEYGLPKIATFSVCNDSFPYPPDVEAEMPKWLWDKIQDLNLCKALNEKAPADFRVNKDRDTVAEKMRLEGFELYKTPYSPIGLRSDKRVNLNNCIAYQEGELDVQDEASQIVCLLADARPTEKVMDYCCGAGGKALTISYLLSNQGTVYVHDINWSRLEAIKDRAERLGAQNIEIVKDVKGEFDCFIIDAPCSGTGTLRRSPDAKFRMTPKRLRELVNIQKEVIEKAVDYISSHGRIIYITCSLLEEENEDVVKGFLANHKDFKLANMRAIWERKIKQPYPCKDDFCLRMSPLSTNTDGFFMAVLERV